MLWCVVGLMVCLVALGLKVQECGLAYYANFFTHYAMLQCSKIWPISLQEQEFC